MLQDSGRFILDIEFEHGVIRFSQLAGLIVEFKFLQLVIEPRAFLAELGVRAGIFRVDSRELWLVVASLRTRARRSELVGLPTGFVLFADQRRMSQRAERDARDQNDERQDPHQKAETSGRRGEQNPFTVFGDKKIFDLLRGFARRNCSRTTPRICWAISEGESATERFWQTTQRSSCAMFLAARRYPVARPPVADSAGADEG